MIQCDCKEHLKGVIDIKSNKYADNPFVVCRIRAGLLQEDVANSLNIDRSTVAQWETGRNSPRADKLIAIASLYGCTVDELLKSDQEGTE